MASVQIDGIDKSFGVTQILFGVDVDIEDGEFVVLVGPSGCGKSTLLRMIAGLEEVGAGEIRIGGQVVNWLEPKDRDVAMVFQNYALYPHFSVFDNMGFSMRIRKMAREVIAERVTSASAILDLDGLLERFPRQLSGGQRQRVAMGRAIVRAPKVFLFDEPLSNLDARLRVQMRTEIKALHGRLDATSIYVTHDQVEAMTMADRIVVMNAGRVEQIGAPLEVYDRPSNAFVAGFIGSPAINLIPGTVRGDGQGDGQGAVVEVAGGARLPLPADVGVGAGTEVLYGVRPEHLAVCEPGRGVAAAVELVEPTGAETLVFASLDGIDLCARTNERHAFAHGAPIGLEPALGRVHLFDPASGARL